MKGLQTDSQNSAKRPNNRAAPQVSGPNRPGGTLQRSEPSERSERPALEGTKNSFARISDPQCGSVFRAKREATLAVGICILPRPAISRWAPGSRTTIRPAPVPGRCVLALGMSYLTHRAASHPRGRRTVRQRQGSPCLCHVIVGLSRNCFTSVVTGLGMKGVRVHSEVGDKKAASRWTSPKI